MVLVLIGYPKFTDWFEVLLSRMRVSVFMGQGGGWVRVRILELSSSTRMNGDPIISSPYQGLSLT